MVKNDLIDSRYDGTESQAFPVLFLTSGFPHSNCTRLLSCQVPRILFEEALWQPTAYNLFPRRAYPASSLAHIHHHDWSCQCAR